MKTPEEWRKEIMFDMSGWSKEQFCMFIETIQRDAINGTLGSVTGLTPHQESLAFAETPEEIRRLNHNIEVYKERWHEARRYLRAANRGAERNNMVMRLQAADIHRLLDRIKQLEQAKQ